MSEEYNTYRVFNDYGLAKDLETTLLKNNIECVLADTSVLFDPSFSNNPLNKEYKIKIRSDNFPGADLVLEKQALLDLVDVDRQHYLFEFNNEELIDLISKRDEWSNFDYLLAKKILEERNVPIKLSDVVKLDVDRLRELSKPEEISAGLIFLGFLFSLLGGVFGITIGWFIWSNRKTLPNGEIIYCYTERNRTKGKIKFIVGLIVLTVLIFSKIYNEINK